MALAATAPCPRCQGPLATREGRGYRLLVCRSCGGLFARSVRPDGVSDLPERSVAEAVGAAAVAAILPDETRRVGCPDCGRHLARYRLDVVPVELDACPAHGVWFDRDELPKLMTGVTRGTRPKATLVAAAGPARRRAVRPAAGLAGAALAAGAAAAAASSTASASSASAASGVASAVGEVAVDAVVEVGFDLVGELISGIFS